MAPPIISADFDFLDPDVNLVGLPWRNSPTSASPTRSMGRRARGCGGFDDGGYWPLTKLADVKEVSRRSDIFSSWRNGVIPRWNNEMARETVELQRCVMLNMDAPHHTRLRKIISRGFTPRAIGRLDDELASAPRNRESGGGRGFGRLRRAGIL